MVSERMPIDFFDNNKLIVKSIIGVYGAFYPISYWYVHSFDENTVTLIGLDNNYDLLLIHPKFIQCEINLLHFYVMFYPDEHNIVINENYFQNFYQNRIITKKPRYGDLILVETNNKNYTPFFILNYDPLGGSHLVSEIDYSNMFNYSSRNHSILLDLSVYKIVSNKELRRDIVEKSKCIKRSLEKCYYERLNIFDEICSFNSQMNYLVEKSEKCEMRLVELDFLNTEDLVIQPLEDLIKFDSLKIENPLEEYLKCYEEDQTEPMEVDDYPDYNYWNINTIINDTSLDEILSFNDQRRLISSDQYYIHKLAYDTKLLENIFSKETSDDLELSSIDSVSKDNESNNTITNYQYKDDLIQFYDSDSEADLKNLETFKYNYEGDNESSEDIRYLISFKRNDVSFKLDIESLCDSIFQEGVSFDPSVEYSLEIKNKKIIESDIYQEETIGEIMDNVIVSVEQKIDEIVDDFETLEKDDFEPFHQEQGCSIM